LDNSIPFFDFLLICGIVVTFRTALCDFECPCGEMDITRGFGPRIVGSSPAGGASEIIDLPTICGYGLVVEHVLAKDETGVRFSLSAPNNNSELQ
jgi:hypothetical protein